MVLSSRPARRSVSGGPAGFTLIELLVVIAIIGILVALLMPALAKAKCVSKNGACQATLSGLVKAMSAYDADMGVYPSKPGQGALTDDTKTFVTCLSTKGPRGVAYFTFKDEDIVNGEFVSPHQQPFHYTFPGGTTAGPDGKTHKYLEYYLWTWGCLNDPPDCDYEINNWSK